MKDSIKRFVPKPTLKAQRAGGHANAIKSRQRALEKYYAAPNICKFCGSVIPVPDKARIREIRTKQFCNRSCAQRFNNHLRERKTHIRPRDWPSLKMTKGELLARHKSRFSVRAKIRVIAKILFVESGRLHECANCGYDKTVNVCHIKAVSDFDDEATIGEINALSNLIGLCPNCHWEYDHGILKLPGR